MNKKLITIICLIVLTTSSFSMLVVNAAPSDIGFMKIELKDVNIIDNHESFPLGTGEIYFKFSMNGSELRTANYENVDDGFTDGEEILAGTDPLDENNFPVLVTEFGTVSLIILISTLFPILSIIIHRKNK